MKGTDGINNVAFNNGTSHEDCQDIDITETKEHKPNGELEKNGIPHEENEKPCSDPDLVEKQEDTFQAYRIGKQTVLVIIWICIGLAGEIVGPTLPDLKDRLGVNYEEVSRVLVGKGVGALFGAIVGGFLNERFYHLIDLFMAICLAVMAAAAIVIPFSKVLILTAAMFAVNGFTEGLINTGGNTVVMHLFGEKSAAPMHSLHFGFGLGALIAPQVARSFLSPDALDDDDDDVTTVPYTTTENYNTSVKPWEDLSRIEIPYGIIAGFIFAFSLVLFGYYLKGPPEGFHTYQPKTDFRTMISPGSCTGGHVCYGVELFVVLFLYYIQAVGGERAYGKFLFSFAIESDIKMKKGDAANLQTAFWASFTAGRGLGVPLAAILPLRSIMVGNMIGNLVVSIVLVIFAENEVLVLWVCSCLIGMLIAVVFPNGMSWANLHLQMNSMAVMILIVGGACGDFIYNYLTGYLFEQEPHNLMYVMVGYAIILTVVYIILELIYLVHGRKIITMELHALQEEDRDVVMVCYDNQLDILCSEMDLNIVNT